MPLPKEEFERLLSEWHRSENAALRAEMQLRSLDIGNAAVPSVAAKASGLRRLADHLFDKIAAPAPQPPDDGKRDGVSQRPRPEPRRGNASPQSDALMFRRSRGEVVSLSHEQR